MFDKKNKEQIIIPQGIDIIYPLDFFDKVEKLCNSFSKIYYKKESNNDNNYLDIIFDKCITFIIEIEQVKIMEYYKSGKPNWSEYLKNLKKESSKENKGE